SKSVRLGDQNIEEEPLILSTIHRAKGLEWNIVFIPMLCEDFFPSSRVIGDPEAFEEDRRVFYVAITRAKDQLYLISPAIVQSYKGPQTARLSQFVSELNSDEYKKSSVVFKRQRGKESKKFKPKFKSALDLISELNQEKKDKSN
ncbi:MAG: 3'-5' exonuclease, partial [Promethearchaeota archaeon]